MLFRILGNDIPVRHGANQTLRNLAFILENEPDLPGCEKRFLLNRIAFPEIRQQLVDLIEQAGLLWHEIPFERSVYRHLATFGEKALYLTNQNAARNRCIDLGFAHGNIVLPFDGQVFISAQGWGELIRRIDENRSGKFFTVPMFRLRSNRHALESTTRPEADANHLWAEPQIAVRAGCDIRFNERLTYGRANKVEMLMRLGVPGPWDKWIGDHIREIRASLVNTRSQEYGKVREAGFVVRLESGNWKADRNISFRAQARNTGLEDFVARVDASLRQPVAGAASAHLAHAPA
ncbi:MAG: hypothetical protein DYH18_09985 [Xanthomonadales bacterium PRO7]|jgi:hypothetical protein|nr:hypothetical protein [Xanthomonadales bacterium PRO7]HMM56127.1 hypothetical protein [Rudaea sp.]